MYNPLKLLSGFVIIEVSGDCPEKLLSRAAANGINLWSMVYRKRKINASLSVRDFARLRPFARGLGIHIHITEKRGIPIFLHRYRHRSGLLVGVAVFFALLYLLSQFVWSIEVKGNGKIDSAGIVSACNTLGIKEGMYRKRLNSAISAQRLLLKLDGLAWAALNLEGSVLTVEVSEIKSTVPRPDEPCNLKAEYDGIITELNVTAGHSEVKIGDTVRKGDVLVSGIWETVENGTRFVHSSGSVKAKIEYSLTAEDEFSQKLYKPNGRLIMHNELRFFGIKIPLYFGKIKGDYDLKIKDNPLAIREQRLPISLHQREYRMKERQMVEYSPDELYELLKERIADDIKALEITDYEIKTETLNPIEGGLTLNIVITAEKDIAVKEKISVLS